MAWTSPRTYSVGEVLTAAFMNTFQRDNLSAVLPSGPTWQTWVPSLNNLTLGNGTVGARYTQIGDAVHGYVEFTLGSTSAVGTAPEFSLPVAASANYTALKNIVGQAIYRGAGQSPGYVRLSDANTVRVQAVAASGSYVAEANVSSAVPFTWASGDTMFFALAYEAA